MSLKRVALWAGAAILALAVVAVGAVFLIFPRVSKAPDLKVEATPALIARGDYLFNHQLACGGCHTPELEPHRFSRVNDKTRIGAGRRMGGAPEFPTDIYAANVTPTALGDWTDGEIYRAIVSGVDRTGRPLFPVMPYPFYKSLDPEDVKAVIAYLRALPPQPVTLPRIKLPMPLPIIMRLVPADPTPEMRPAAKNEVALGRYLAFSSSCFECHTKRNERGEPTGTPFAGDNPFGLPGGGVARSANITPDKETGIGSWTRAQFIARFRAMTPEAAAKMAPEAHDADTEMPWTNYSAMTDEDLGAIYAYLQTVPPVHAKVETFTPPAK